MTAELSGISSMATRQILADLSRAYEQLAGHAVAIRSMGGLEAARLVRAGERTDVVILASGVMETLEGEGHLVPGSRVDVARSGIAVAIPAGAPKPDLSTAEAVKRAMIAARRVCYSTGPSGDHLKRLWRRWNIESEMNARSLQAPPGVPVAALLARGDADFGLQQLSELLGAPDIDVVGMLPADIQSTTIFTAAIANASAHVEESRAFIAFLTSDAAAAAKRQYGMEPA